MLFRKKVSISLLAALVASPNLTFGTPPKVTSTTTTTTTTSNTPSNKATITVKLPFSKKTGEEILGGTIALATVAGLYGLYALYQKWGGPKNIDQFLQEADARAKSVISAQDALNKKISKASYQEMTDSQKIELTQTAYEGYFTDNAAKLFGLEPDEFKSWFQSLGTDLITRTKASRVITDQLSVDPSRTIPDSLPGDLPYQASVRYAVKNKITSREVASEKVTSFPETRTIDPLTGKGISEGPAANLGRAAKGAASAAGDAAADLARGVAKAGNAIASGAREIPVQARAVAQGYQAADQSAGINFGGGGLSMGGAGNPSIGGAGGLSSGGAGGGPNIAEMRSISATQAANFQAQSKLAQGRQVGLNDAAAMAQQDKTAEAEAGRVAASAPSDSLYPDVNSGGDRTITDVEELFPGV